MTEPKPKKKTSVDMTTGPILWHILFFAFPLMLGNLFQMMYSTADTIVLGNFAGKEALAAVGATTMITNLAVFFFSGFSTGASVAIARSYGARDNESIHKAVETSVAMTFLISLFFTAAGIPAAAVILRLMGTPEDVFPQAAAYIDLNYSRGLFLNTPLNVSQTAEDLSEIEEYDEDECIVNAKSIEILIRDFFNYTDDLPF